MSLFRAKDELQDAYKIKNEFFKKIKLNCCSKKKPLDMRGWMLKALKMLPTA